MSYSSIRQFYLSCLSQASYLVTDHASRQSIVVDPVRDVEQYIAAADEAGATIVGVVNTHFHADFVTGNQELAAQTGAWIAMGDRAEAHFPFRPLADDQVIRIGATTARIWHTPGHTPESVCVLVGAGAQVEAALTGDTLFVGDVGRPDLVAAGGAEIGAPQMAVELHSSLQRLLTLPDSVAVLPAHGAGSSCGKNLSADTTSTVGRERRTNPMLAPMSVGEFVDLVTSDQPEIPAYFSATVRLNKQPRHSVSEPVCRPISADELAATLTPETVVVDVRAAEQFADGHIRGAVNIGLDGRLAETAGMVLDFGKRFIIAATDADTAAQAHRRFRRIGLDSIDGYILPATDGFELVSCARVLPAELPEPTAPCLLIDVRSPGEVASEGCVRGAINVPLVRLRAWLAEPGNRDRLLADGAVVYCAGGWRSSVAASLLRAETGAAVRDVVGGYSAISVVG